MNESKIYQAYVIEKLSSWNIPQKEIKDESVLKNVYDLFKDNKYIDSDNEIYMHLAGVYAEYHKNDIKLAERYYLTAIEKGSIDSINNLAILYNEQNKNTLAKKYFSMAVEKGCADSLYNMALFYRKIKKYKLAEKYFLMAINERHIDSMHSLAMLYYQQVRYDASEKYFLMAMNEGHINSIRGLAQLFYKQEKYEMSRHYYIMGALNYNKMSLKKVNELMIQSFNLDDSIKLINVLNDHNYNTLNDVLKFIVIETDIIHK